MRRFPHKGGEEKLRGIPKPIIVAAPRDETESLRRGRTFFPTCSAGGAVGQ